MPPADESYATSARQCQQLERAVAQLAPGVGECEAAASAGWSGRRVDSGPTRGALIGHWAANGVEPVQVLFDLIEGHAHSERRLDRLGAL